MYVVQSYDSTIHSIHVDVLGYICSYTSKSGQQSFHFPCCRLKPTNFAVSLQKRSPKNMCCIIAGLIPLKQENLNIGCPNEATIDGQTLKDVSRWSVQCRTKSLFSLVLMGRI